MASNKLSALSAVSGSLTSDSLVYIADTQDSGSSYSSKKITVANLLSDVASTTDLGTFTGSTMSDASTIKAALQDLETGVEAAQSGSAVADRTKTVTDATDATRYLTFVADDNGSATAETVFTDGGITYNPASNLLSIGAADIATLKVGGVAVTSTAAELNILDGVTSTTAELNILDGVTATTAELNILDGVTSTAAELNILDGFTSTTA